MSYAVNRIPLVWIPMCDGTKLAAKLWIPESVEKSNEKAADAECEKYPAILGEINLCKYSGVVYSGVYCK